MDRVTKKGVRTTFLGLVALALAAVLLPSAFADAKVKVKVKNGTYYQEATSKRKSFGWVETDNGKVDYVGFYGTFKKGSADCIPSGYYSTEGYLSIKFTTKPTKPDSKGKFTVTNKLSNINPGLHATVKGQIKNHPDVASLKMVLRADGCVAEENFNNATFTPND
jgi:hypothetical protein